MIFFCWFWNSKKIGLISLKYANFFLANYRWSGKFNQKTRGLRKSCCSSRGTICCLRTTHHGKFKFYEIKWLIKSQLTHPCTLSHNLLHAARARGGCQKGRADRRAKRNTCHGSHLLTLNTQKGKLRELKCTAISISFIDGIARWCIIEFYYIYSSNDNWF